MTDYQLTTTGLRGTPFVANEVLAVNWAAAAGTVNAITAEYDPANTSLPDGLILGFRATGANTTTTPTFSPDGLTAHTITKFGGVALETGDIYGAGHEVLVRYKLASTRWELLNPAKSSKAGEQTTTRAANATLAITDVGVIQDVTEDGVVLTLPSTVVGYTFIARNACVSDNAVGFSFSPAAADKIAGNGFTATDDKDVTNTKATAKRGDMMVLVGDGVNGWFIQHVIGTWARQA